MKAKPLVVYIMAKCHEGAMVGACDVNYAYGTPRRAKKFDNGNVLYRVTITAKRVRERKARKARSK